MVSRETIEIIIRAVDEASKTAEKIDNSLEKMGSTGQNIMNKLSNASNRFQNALGRIGDYSNKIKERFQSLTSANNVFNSIRGSISNTVSSLGNLIHGTNNTSSAMEKIKSVTGSISQVGTNVFNGLKNRITGVVPSLTKLRLNIDKATSSMRKLSSSGKGLSGLKNGIGMIAAIIGFELVSKIGEAGHAAIQAEQKFKYFASRLKLSGNQIKNLRQDISKLQNEFKKVNMTEVGATAEELAVKYNVPIKKIGDLTRMTAVMSSEFVRQGRTQEDAILAVGDAMDGEFRRLKEIGISQDMLKNNGWSGEISDQITLIDALNKTMKDMGYEQTAKDIVTLDDAMSALNVKIGQLIGGAFTRLEPVLMGIAKAALDVMDALGQIGGAIMDFIANLPDEGKIILLVGALGMLATIISITLVPSLYAAASAIWAAMAPILPYIAAAAAMAIAIYEVGKAFGWWKDLPTMFQAIGDGLKRIWNTFTENENVQESIHMLSMAWWEIEDALKAVGDVIGPVFKELNGGKELDAVGLIILSVATDFRIFATKVKIVADIISGAIKFIVDLFTGDFSNLGPTLGPIVQGIHDALMPIICVLLGCSPGIVPALQKVWEVMQSVWNNILALLSPIIQPIVSLVQGLINIFQLFVSGQISLPDLISGILTRLANTYISILHGIIGLVDRFTGGLISKAIRAGQGFVNGIINFIKTLPGKIRSFLSNVLTTIRSKMSEWVNTAKNKAHSVVQGITGAWNGLVSTVQGIWNGVKNAITKPISDAWNYVSSKVDAIKSKIKDIPVIGGAFGGEPAGGETVAGGETYPEMFKKYPHEAFHDDSFNFINNDEETITIKHDVNLSLDLQNVPSHISTSDLIKLLSDKKVLTALTSDNNFQELDWKVKNKLNLKYKRFKGI